MPGVLEAVAFGTSRRERQDGIETIQGWNGDGGALLRQAGMVVGAQAVTSQLAAKPGDSFRRQIVAQKLYCVGVRQIQFGIGIEAPELGAPVFAFQHGEQLF